MTSLHTLLVTAQAEVIRVFRATLGEDDALSVASEMSAAVTLASLEQPALVFIDMTLPGGSGLALVHHVLATHPKAAIVALAPSRALENAAEALSLGATALLLSPPDGDAILRAVSDVRTRRGAEETIARVTAERAALLDQADAMTRAVTVARTGNDHDIAEALVALFVLASGARGVAYFGPEMSDGTRSRLATYGSGYELRDRYDDDELARIATSRGAAMHAFGPVSRSLGCVLLERASESIAALPHKANAPEFGVSERTMSAVHFANALLMISARAAASLPPAPESRVVPEDQFVRMVERALEGGAPALVVSLPPSQRNALDMAKLPLADETTLFGQRQDGGAWILYPGKTAQDGYSILAILCLRGASFASHADTVVARELLQLAEMRSKEAERSPYFELRSVGSHVGEFAASILQSASLESRISSLFPLELSSTSLESLLAHAMRQAVRAPKTSPSASLRVFVAHSDPSRALRFFEREPVTVEIADVRGVPGCESLDAIVVLSPRASWALSGRWEKDRLRAVHTCDPMMCATLADRIMSAKEGAKR